MKKLIAMLGAVVAAVTSAWAATPVAVWEDLSVTGGALTVNGVTLNPNVSETGNTIAGTAVKIVDKPITLTLGDNHSIKQTVLVKYSGITENPATESHLVSFTTNDAGNDYIGVSVNADGDVYGSLSGVHWNNNANVTTGKIPLDSASHLLAARFKMSYASDANLRGTFASVDGQTKYNVAGLVGQNQDIKGIAIGGGYLSGTTGKLPVMVGMVVEKVAVFNDTLTEADIAAFKWPSAVTVYTCTVDGETASWDRELPAEIEAGDSIVFTGSGTVALPAGHAGDTITVGSGVTLVVSESGLTQTKLTNEGTVHFVGGTLEAPIEMTLDGAHQSGFGVVTIGANSVLKTSASNQNKKYLVTGAADGSSTLILASSVNWGMQNDTLIRNCTAIIEREFWFENVANMDKTVDLVVNAPLHLSNGDFEIGSLSGTANFASGNKLTLNLDRGDATYAGDASTAFTINGTHTQTFTGNITGNLVVNTTVTTSAQIPAARLSTTISGYEVQETDNQDGTFTYVPVASAVIAHIGDTPYATLDDALAVANQSESPVTVTLDVSVTAETIALSANVTLDCSEGIYTGAVTGAGTIKFVGFGSVPAAVKTALQSESWTGTLSVSPAASGQLGSGDNTVGAAPTYKTLLNDFGNEGSKIEFDNFVAETNINFFGLTADEDSVIKPEVVITGTFSIRNGYSHRSDTAGYHTTFRKISGDGLIDCPRSDRFSPLYYILDASDFTGSLNTTSSKFVFGPCEESDTVEKIPSPSTYSGFIWVKEGTTINVAEGKTFSATTMIVDGTLNTHTALETIPSTYLEGKKIVAPEAVEGVYTYVPTAITYVTVTIETVENCTITVMNGETAVETGATFDIDDATELTVTRTPAAGYHLADGCLAEETVTMSDNQTITATVEKDATRPSAVEGGSQAQKDAYDAWAAEVGITDPTESGVSEAFALELTAEDITAADSVEEAVENELDALLAQVDLSALSGEGGISAAVAALNEAYDNATFTLKAVEEIETTANLYRLSVEFLPADGEEK